MLLGHDPIEFSQICKVESFISQLAKVGGSPESALALSTSEPHAMGQALCQARCRGEVLFLGDVAPEGSSVSRQQGLNYLVRGQDRRPGPAWKRSSPSMSLAQCLAGIGTQTFLLVE